MHCIYFFIVQFSFLINVITNFTKFFYLFQFIDFLFFLDFYLLHFYVLCYYLMLF